MAKLQNGTPHAVKLVDDAGNVVFELPAGEVIRCETNIVEREPLTVDGVTLPTVETTFGDSNLPPFVDGTFWVVSMVVKAAHPNRQDLLVPADLVRNDEGMVVGCRAFGR